MIVIVCVFYCACTYLCVYTPFWGVPSPSVPIMRHFPTRKNPKKKEPSISA